MYMQIDFTPLMEASRSGNTEITQLLLENGADPNMPNSVSRHNAHITVTISSLPHTVNMSFQPCLGRHSCICSEVSIVAHIIQCFQG